jgi:hypothetical protein
MALLGGQNRRWVVFVKKMEQEEGERLTDTLRIVMGEKVAVMGQTFGSVSVHFSCILVNNFTRIVVCRKLMGTGDQ